MADVQKQISLAHDLAAELSMKQSLAVVESFGSTGLPIVKVGAATAGAAGALIRVVPQSWALQTDILGSALNIISPSVMQVLFETTAGSDISSYLQLAQILSCVALRGTAIEIYARANGTALAEAAITAGNLKGTINAHPVYGMIANT